MKIGFDNDKYLSMQSEHIKERIGQFGDKLYLEFGGKLFDDYHASRVLPGFAPDSKLRMLLQLADQAEVVIVISAADIEKSKVRHDLGITYDVDVLRLIQEFQGKGLYVGSVVITQYSGQSGADQFKVKLEHMGIRVYRHYCIEGYPSNIPLIVSDEGYGKNDYIETSRPLVVITAPGPGSGKMVKAAKALGLKTAGEVFADRAYMEDGTLVPRSQEGAVITDEEEAVARVLEMVQKGTVTAITGKKIAVQADSICVHGDGQKALLFVQKIRSELEKAGVVIAPMKEVIVGES